MKHLIYTFLIILLGSSVVIGCKKDEKDFSPSVPYSVVFNDSIYHNGDSLYGCVTINQDSMVAGTMIKKIDCRLDNIVIGSVENQMECPFGVRLMNKPIGDHTFSIIIKCESPDCDETFWRYDFVKHITIKP